MTSITINGRELQVEGDPATPLLWVLREMLGMTGTKFGCGAGLCGACTVHLDGEAVRSCQTPLAMAEGRQVRTIEALGEADGKLHPLQQAWIDVQVPQCGYCQSGQLMSAAALLHNKPNPSDADIDAAMSGNICRCGAYGRIRKAIKAAAAGNSAPATARAEG